MGLCIGLIEDDCHIEYKIGDKSLYSFAKGTGILQVSMDQNGLELILKEVGEIPETGRDLVLPLLSIYGPALVRLKGVKSIVLMD